MKLQLVEARSGVTWVREGIRTFARQPLVFFSLFMLFMAAIAMLSVFPVIGGGLGLVAVPAMTLAMLVATEQVSKTPTDVPRTASAAVFATALGVVRQRAKPLVILGVMYAVSIVVVVMLASAFDDPDLGPLIRADGSPDMEVMQSGAFQMSMWVRLALYLPVSLLFWHAPALVHWGEVSPAKTLFFSIVACIRNFGAMSMFGIVWFGVALGASALLGLVASLAIGLGGGGAAGGLAMAVMVGGSLALTAMFFCTTWFMFRDNFSPD